MMVGAVLVSGAATATADPIDDAYLAQLHAQGFTWPPDHNDYMVKLALHICINRLRGWPPDQVAQNVHSVLGHDGLTLEHVSDMVNTAEATYCPS
jgi:hypothetical protein